VATIKRKTIRRKAKVATPAAKKVRKSYKPTKQQKDLWDAMSNSDQHILGIARAGTGKTTTIVDGFSKVKSSRKAIVAFSKLIATELQGRVGPSTLACTVHSLGFRLLKDKGYAVDGVNFNKIRDIYRECFGRSDGSLEIKDWELIYDLEKVVGLAKGCLVETPEEILALVKHYGMALEDEEKIAERASMCIEESRRLTDRVDYDDMCWLPIQLKLKPAPFGAMGVDETQDLNVCQRQLLSQFSKRFIVIGDPEQCQPRGTKVLATGRGYVPIQDLKVGDQLATYKSKDTYSPGHNTQGRKIEKIEHHEHNGDLIHGNGTCTTLEHRWLVRFDPKKGKKLHAVYLMLSGDIPRIGTTQLQMDCGFGPGVRARGEKVDCLWVLDVFPTRQEARKLEWLLSLKYQIPQRAMFEWTNRSWEEELERDLKNPERIGALLQEFGRHPRYPMWEKGSAQHVGYYSFMCRGYNLLNGCMMVVRVKGPRDCSWEPLQFTRKRYVGEVWSLQVAPTEGGRRLYIADEIATGNSIFGFRGADAESIPRFRERLLATERGLIELPLTVSWRCPKNVVRLAQTIVPDLEAAPNAPDGIAAFTSREIEDIEPPAMVLCRTNAPLFELFNRLFAQQIPVYVRGRDMIPEFVGLAKKAFGKETSWENHINVLDQYQAHAEAHLIRNDAPQMAIAALEDRVQCVKMTVTDCKNAKDYRKKLNGILSDEAATEGGYILSTIHRAKGLEADRVVILRPDLLPHPYATAAWEQVQESNLRYVAITRAKQALFILGDKFGL